MHPRFLQFFVAFLVVISLFFGLGSVQNGLWSTYLKILDDSVFQNSVHDTPNISRDKEEDSVSSVEAVVVSAPAQEYRGDESTLNPQESFFDGADSSVENITSDVVDESRGEEFLLMHNESRISDPIHLEINTTVDETPSTMPPILSKVVAVEGIEQLYAYLAGSWTGKNPFCETIRELREAEPSVFITFNITFSCQELYDRSEAGTGNYLAYFYGLRRTAWSYENVELIYHCYDAEETKYDLILPWITGRVPARPPGVHAGDEAEGPHCYYGPSYLEVRQDLRKMALALYGLPKSLKHDHPLAIFSNQLWSQQEPENPSLHRRLFIPQLSFPQRLEDVGSPPYGDLDLDEVALHFRCGDLMDSANAAFSFMRFQGYVRHISTNATTIGVLTQPFDDDSEQARWADAASHVKDRCRTVVLALVDYIQERYPMAHITIRNDRTERITQSYLRMIMAQQTISGISSFGVMPAVATFGKGYIRTPDRPSEPYYWVLFPRIDEVTEGQVVLFEEPSMAVIEMKYLWEQEGKEGVLAWFLNDTTSAAV